MTQVPSRILLPNTVPAGPPRGVWWKGAALFAVAVSVVACSSATPAASSGETSSSGDTSTTSPARSAAPSAPSSASASSAESSTTVAAGTSMNPGSDVAAACEAVLTLNAAQPPGTDPDGPTPTKQELATWAGKVQPALTMAAAGAPAELSASFATLQKTADAAKNGTPVNTDDPVLNEALRTINASVHDNCGFQTLDVTNSGGALVGVPATLDAGPLAVEFTNSTNPGKASFVLLVARIKDGQSVPLADIQSGKADLAKVSDVLAGVQPTGPDPTYTTTTLTPGHYVVASPLGTPPSFSGIIAVEFDVK